MDATQDALKRAQDALQNAEKVFVVTGAGISAESGVPTFRDPGGLWKKIDPYKVATPEAFADDPVYVWKWYDERRNHLVTTEPNPGHYSLAALEERIDNFYILTQNIDDLHERAGSKKVGHIHGNIWEVRCTNKHGIREERQTPLSKIPPECPNCGAMERPNVVWFGEMIDEAVVAETDAFLAGKDADVVIVIGTEASFPYITGWARAARGSTGTLMEINLGQTGLTPYTDLYLPGKSGEILPIIADTL